MWISKMCIRDSFTLPSVPQVANYRNTGWAKSKNTSSASYSSREKIKVKNSMTLYAAREYLPYAVTFNNNTGTSKDKAFKDLYVRAAKNEYITLPKVPAQKGYTAVGWSTKTKQTKAQYKEGQKVKITKKTKFYAVYRLSLIHISSWYLTRMRMQRGWYRMESIKDRSKRLNLTLCRQDF